MEHNSAVITISNDETGYLKKCKHLIINYSNSNARRRRLLIIVIVIDTSQLTSPVESIRKGMLESPMAMRTTR